MYKDLVNQTGKSSIQLELVEEVEEGNFENEFVEILNSYLHRIEQLSILEEPRIEGTELKTLGRREYMYAESGHVEDLYVVVSASEGLEC